VGTRLLAELLSSRWRNLKTNSYHYRTDIGKIDLLAHHKKGKAWLVVEIKRNQSSDDTVGQAPRYMGYVREHLVSAAPLNSMSAAKLSAAVSKPDYLGFISSPLSPTICPGRACRLSHGCSSPRPTIGLVNR